MCGRATIVLEVLEYEGYVAGNPEQAQIFVMKQSWQRLPLKNNYNINQLIALENSLHPESDTVYLQVCLRMAILRVGRSITRLTKFMLIQRAV
ncbi:hypothetical protein M422DRAFT_274097 [Sphaerobolus stellatus SS14]|uniref:Uncharacterized protein n=1 Tax=Sphaerobolus stellatus (strain SS14) TaxID=990650 RepID=A0A0C9U7H3_SPHS4|nr:hypothetical protein M422DRAFT_274097 [Sphaerobolus stellatus SS14]